MCANANFLIAIDEAFNRHSWHGVNLRGSLRGVSAVRALARPAPGRHNIWELTSHCAYWKFVARRRLTGDTRARFEWKGSNFFPSPETADEQAWKKTLALLFNEHRKLRDAVAQLAAGRLKDEKAQMILRGIVAHDLYHAGQIQLIKRLTA